MKIESTGSAYRRIRSRPGTMLEYFSNPNFDVKGKAVVVLGNSPALKEVDLTPLKDVLTIGVNRICRVFTPDVLLLTDPPILKAEEAWFKDFKGPILTWHGFHQEQWVVKSDKIRFFNLQPVSPHANWSWPKTSKDPIIRQGTTPPYALQIAALAGAKAIALLGTDLNATNLAKAGKESHFYGHATGRKTCMVCDKVFPNSSVVAVGPKRLAKCPECGVLDKVVPFVSTGGGGWSSVHDAFFTKFPSWAKALGVSEVVNLSPYTDTPIHKANWPKMTLKEFADKYSDGS
jgi:hypothetical protein